MRKTFIAVIICLGFIGFLGAAIFLAPPEPISITVAECVQGSVVRINCHDEIGFIRFTGTGTILKIESRGDKKIATILTAGHLIKDSCINYSIDYVATLDGAFIGYERIVANVIAVKHDVDLAIIECDGGLFDERYIKTKIYNGSRSILFNKDIYVSSYPLSLGPVFSRGYINVTGMAENFIDYIAFNGVVDYGTSGATIRLAETGEIIGVVSTVLASPDGKVQGEMNCIPFDLINKFLEENSIKLD